MTGQPIELHCDLDVDPSKEKDLIETFHSVFAPTMAKQPGWVAVSLLKLETAKRGPAPANTSHRLVISFATEDCAWLGWRATITSESGRKWRRISAATDSPRSFGTSFSFNAVHLSGLGI